MKIADIVALAKAGYKYSEVKELIQLASDTKDDPEKEEQKEEQETEPEKEEQKQNEAKEKETEPDTETEADDPDYKALYEESQKQLKAAQAANRKQPKEEPKTAEEIALEHFKDILH